jgi:hypothetical protein
MGFATHLGPWLLGTVKNTTGTTAGLIRNLGAAVVSQSQTVGFSTVTGTLCVLPAGAQINSVTVYTTTGFSAYTSITLSIGGTDITTSGVIGSNAITSAGSYFICINETTPAKWLNVGTTDAIVTYVLGFGDVMTAGAATVVVNYVVRGSDGSAFQTSIQQ